MTHEATNAPFAGRLTRLAAIVWQAFGRRSPSGLTSGPAPSRNASTQPKPDGAVPTPALSPETLIHRRALRTCNRRRDQVDSYTRVHTILGRGRFCD